MKKTLFFTMLLAGFTATDIAIGPWQASGTAAAWAAGPKALVTVNGKAITADELTKRLWWQHAAQGLTDLVDERLLLDEAARLGVKTDEKEADKKLEALRANYKNKEEFQKSLKSVNWSEQDLKNLLQNQILLRNTVLAARKIAVTDEDAKSFYTKNKERFNTPESARLLQIFVTTKAEAEDAYMALAAGADFAKLSSLKSTDANLKKNGGSLGFIAKGMLQPELEKEVFALKPGEYTKPLATGTGYSILKLEELKPPQEVSYETAKEDIKAALVNQALSQEMPKLIAELRAKAKLEVAK
ncbi:MAG: peptidyl-prolyl cis-trans isomerase [Elusimicrobia bacterium]|nr:peptidyl-prolyl cis-trans isomerase [Elusimicrobiota bacterium]